MILAFKYNRKQNKKERRFVMNKKIYFITAGSFECRKYGLFFNFLQ